MPLVAKKMNQRWKAITDDAGPQSIMSAPIAEVE
jgi:hypothetical protein